MQSLYACSGSTSDKGFQENLLQLGNFERVPAQSFGCVSPRPRFTSPAGAEQQAARRVDWMLHPFINALRPECRMRAAPWTGLTHILQPMYRPTTCTTASIRPKKASFWCIAVDILVSIREVSCLFFQTRRCNTQNNIRCCPSRHWFLLDRLTVRQHNLCEKYAGPSEILWTSRPCLTNVCRTFN